MKRTERIRLDFTIPGDSATKAVTIKTRKNGFVKLAVIDTQNIAAENTATITFNDVDGYEVFKSAAIAGSATPTKVGSLLASAAAGAFPCEPNYTCTCTVATALLAAKVVTVIFYVEANGI